MERNYVTVTLCIYCVPQKSHKYFTCMHEVILIIFDKNVTEKLVNQKMLQLLTSNHCFCTAKQKSPKCVIKNA